MIRLACCDLPAQIPLFSLRKGFRGTWGHKITVTKHTPSAEGAFFQILVSEAGYAARTRLRTDGAALSS